MGSTAVTTDRRAPANARARIGPLLGEAASLALGLTFVAAALGKLVNAAPAVRFVEVLVAPPLARAIVTGAIAMEWCIGLILLTGFLRFAASAVVVL